MLKDICWLSNTECIYQFQTLFVKAFIITITPIIIYIVTQKQCLLMEELRQDYRTKADKNT